MITRNAFVCRLPANVPEREASEHNMDSGDVRFCIDLSCEAITLRKIYHRATGKPPYFGRATLRAKAWILDGEEGD
jgi:hypothetical protein